MGWPLLYSDSDIIKNGTKVYRIKILVYNLQNIILKSKDKILKLYWLKKVEADRVKHILLNN